MVTVTDTQVEVQATEFEFTLDQAAEAVKKVSKANQRLAKNGIQEQFKLEVVEYFQREEKEGLPPFQTVTIIQMARMSLSVPSISFGGWELAATLVIEEGGTILRTVPGVDLSDWQRPEIHFCDHCQKSLPRTKSYAVRNPETGEVKQVGSSCISLFLGVNIETSLWAVTWDLEEEVGKTEAGSRRPAEEYPIRNWIRLVIAVSNHGREWVSASSAYENEMESTKEKTLEAWHFKGSERWIPEAKKEQIRNWRAEALTISEEEIDEVIQAGFDVDPESDYGQNLHVALRSTTVSGRSLGILTSVISAYRRQKEIKAEQKKKAADSVQGFIGEVGDKVKNLELTLVRETGWDSDFGWTNLYTFNDEAGHTIIWKSGNNIPADIGEKIIVTSGSIKETSVYNGQDQTVLTCCRVKAA